MKELTFSEQNSFLHHGIEGQKWGVRNGPPYPLDSQSDSDYKQHKQELKEEKKYYKHKEGEKYNPWTKLSGYYHKHNGIDIFGERVKKDENEKLKFISPEESMSRRKKEKEIANGLNKKELNKYIKDAFSGDYSKQLYDSLEWYESEVDEFPKFDRSNMNKYFEFNMIEPHYSLKNGNMDRIRLSYFSNFDNAGLSIYIDPETKKIINAEYELY